MINPPVFIVQCSVNTLTLLDMKTEKTKRQHSQNFGFLMVHDESQIFQIVETSVIM